MPDDIDTFNAHLVSVKGDRVVMMLPPSHPMTPDQALVLAAWLVTTMADPAGERFPRVLAAVQDT